MEPKSSQHATYVGAVCVCVCVCFGAFWGYFSFRFLHRFLIDFVIDVGVVLGGFWEAFGRPNRSFLASVF